MRLFAAVATRWNALDRGARGAILVSSGSLTLVVMATANHYLVDGLAGSALVTLAMAGVAGFVALRARRSRPVPAPGFSADAAAVPSPRDPEPFPEATTSPSPGAPAGASELYLKQNIFIHNFANDLPRAQAERLWASQRGASTVAFGTSSKAAAWKTLSWCAATRC